MSIIEKYTCPRCGFILTLDLSSKVYKNSVNCAICDKEMRIYSKYTPYNTNNKQRKAHYLHKSLLN